MIWPFYASILALIFLWLSVRTLRLRRRLRIAVGDGGSALMLRAMRAHANFSEYVPLGLLLIIACEQLHAPAALLHALGLALVAGRLIHAAGITKEAEVFAFRVSGMALTFTCYLTAALFVLIKFAEPLAGR